MLLRIDKLCGKADGPSSPPSDPPIHVCLVTATVQEGTSPASGSSPDDNNNDNNAAAADVIPGSPKELGINYTGEIATVGRKNCIVNIEDKSMSRTHATIALLSNKTLDPNDVAPASSLLADGRVMMEYGKPTTPEEIHACETSDTGVICVVRDKGSKFGTYISVDENLLREYSPKNDAGNEKSAAGDGDETGDETDDEGATTSGKQINFHTLSANQARAVQLMTSFNGNRMLPKFQQLEKNSSSPLLQLSHSSKANNEAAAEVIILFGPQGSSIRLSLHPLQFTFSQMKKSELDPLLASLHYIGATHSTQWNAKSSTHLVTPKKIAGAKGIMAWACRRPSVTPGYIEALLGRRDALEELPKDEDYCPSGDWDSNMKWTPEPCNNLKGYRVAVMVDDDNAPLVQSAGADVLPLHKEAPTSSQDEFQTWWGNQVQKAIDDKLALVVVSSSSKKCKKIHDWLKHHDDVRYIAAKNIAKAITGNNGEGDLLKDTKSTPIEKPEGWDAVVEDAGSKEKMDEQNDEDHKMPAAKEGEEAVEPVEPEPANQMEEEPADEPAPTKKKTKGSKTKSPTKSKRRQEEDAGDEEEEHVEEEQPKRRRKKKEKEAPVEEDEPPAEEEEAPVEEEPSKQKKKVVYQSDDEPGLPDERIDLPKTADGWFVAAGSKRKAYRKNIRHEEAVIDEDVPEISAESENVSLIVREYVPNKRAGAGGRIVSRARSGKKKKDFKRFRKNSVIRGYTTFNSNDNSSALPKIRLVDVMPKESERQRQLQQQQEDLEREQELADQLFNDAPAKSGRKRKGGGSMDQYLTQKSTTTKAKRGRGRR